MLSTSSSYNLIMPLQIKETDFKASHKQFLVMYGKKQFYCGFLIKEILVGLNEYCSLHQIHSRLITNTAYQKLTLQDIESIIDKKIKPLGIFKRDETQNSDSNQEALYGADSIKVQKTLLNESKTNFLAQFFSFFYQKWAVVLFGLGGLFVHIFYFSSHSIFGQHAKIWEESSALEYMLIYFLVILIFIFHEIGHASAALHFGIRAPKVGYGFYLIYPVFFTQISEAWKLHPKKRMVINLGGIYFQWIAGIFFIGLDYFNVASTGIWAAIATVNFIRLLYSFIPFMKSDGYWLFSDGFGLTNLRQKTVQYLLSIFKSFSFQEVRQITTSSTQFYALSFFSFGSLIFFGWWFIFLGKIIWRFIHLFPTILTSLYQKWQVALLISEYLKIIFQSFLMSIIILGVIIFMVKMIGLIRFGLHFLLKKQEKQIKLI